MDLTELQTRVNRYVRLDLRPLYEAYRAQGGADDTDGFIAFLGTSRVVDATVLKDLHGLGGVEVPTLEDPALRGTAVAAWVGGATRPEQPLGTTQPMEPVREAPQAPKTEVHYAPIALLGQGAMGAIQIARDLYLRRKVALKTVLPEMAVHPQLLGRFLSEMQITAQLEHPNIVPIYGLEIGANGSLGYAMKLVHGKDLAQIIDETRAAIESGKPLEADHKLEKRLEYFLKVCDALEVAHLKGIVHRDLKPANIMIGRHNEVYLMDWGIARPMGEGGQALEAGIELHEASGRQTGDLSRTRIGSAIGTPPYMSPEQAAGRNAELDGRSDQYAMGLILQECVTLQGAVQGTTLQEILTKAREAKRDPVAPNHRYGVMPREIEAIVRRATRLDPKDRYPSVRELAEEVRRYLRGEAVHALPEGGMRRASRWISKHRMTSLVLMLGLGLVGATATIGSLIVEENRMAGVHARELRVSQLQTESAIEAQLVDRELSRYESGLEKLVGAIQLGLSSAPPGESAPFFDEQFATKGSGPADLGPSARYGQEVSVISPVISLAPGVERGPLEALLHSFGWAPPAFRELMIESGGIDAHAMSHAQQRVAIADIGMPAFRVALALREGITLSFPGMAGLPAGDSREATFFKVAQGTTGVKWGAPMLGEKHSLLPASAALYDDRGAFRGVVLLEVSLDRLLVRPEMEKLDYVQSRLLVTRDGKLMAEENQPGGRAPLAPEVLEAIGKGQSGHLQTVVDGRTLQYAYYPLASLDWYFVAVSEANRMMASTTKIETSDPRRVRQASTPPPPPPPDTSPHPVAAAPVADLDAGADADLDAGPDAEADAAPPDAGNPFARDGGWPVPAHSGWKLPTPPIPSAVPSASPVATAAPTAAPSAAPPNPFDKWHVYDKKPETK